MKLTLRRMECGKVTTLGELFLDGKRECLVLEDADRQLELNPTAKVYGQTCIPRGTYQIIITYSNRFKRELPLLVDVPGFEGIRIHPGNTHEDTQGCLLPGTSFATNSDGVHTVVNSRNAFCLLYAKIEGALDKGEIVEIEVT